jgi:hypothetical protein
MVFNRLKHWFTSVSLFSFVPPCMAHPFLPCSKGPVSSLFRRFMMGHTPLPTKISNCSYSMSFFPFSPSFCARLSSSILHLTEARVLMLRLFCAVFSYWAIAIAPPLTLVYWFLQGNFQWQLNSAFQPSFNIFLAVLVIYVRTALIAVYRLHRRPSLGRKS